MVDLFFKEPKDYLRFEFELRKSRRPAYSMRAFARDINMSPSGLSDFMNDRVGMSEARVAEIADKLQWPLVRREHFNDLILSKGKFSSSDRKAALLRVRSRVQEQENILSEDEFKTMSDWYYLVIVELCNLYDQVDAQMIFKKIGLELKVGQKALHRLLKLNILHETKRGPKPVKTDNYFGDRHPSEAIRQFHFQFLSRAQRALLELSPKERESQSWVFSVPTDKISELHSELRRALVAIAHKYSELADQNPNIKKSIHGVSLQAFPLTRHEDTI